MQWTRIEQEDLYVDPLQSLNCRFFEPGSVHPMLDHSYLNDKDRANPAIMANVKAMNVILSMSSFVVENDNSDLFGYWHGPEQLPIDRAPIICVDSEGQFRLCEGLHLADALISTCVYDDETFAQRKQWFAAYDIQINAESLESFPDAPNMIKPDELSKELYEKFSKE